MPDYEKQLSDVEKLRPASAPAAPFGPPAEPAWLRNVSAEPVSDDVVAIGKEACGDLGLRNYSTTQASGGGAAEIQRRAAERSAPLPPVSQRPGPARSAQLDAQIRAADRAIDAFEQLEARVRARRDET